MSLKVLDARIAKAKRRIAAGKLHRFEVRRGQVNERDILERLELKRLEQLRKLKQPTNGGFHGQG